jgi:GxxExxY protein
MSVIHTPLAHAVIDGAIRVHRRTGPGLLESVYQACLIHELSKAGLEIARQVPVPLIYDELHLSCAFRIDLVVAGTLMVELKSVDRILPVHHAQTLTYLRLSRLQQALLINFNVPRLTMGLKSYLGRPMPSADASQDGALEASHPPDPAE